MTNSTVSSNSAGNRGGGVFNYSGTLIVTNSTVSDNKAVYSGGGIDTFSGSTWRSVTTLIESTVSGNSSMVGGGIANNADLTLTRSIVFSNIGMVGGGIVNQWSGTLTVANSTIAVNAATDNVNSWGGGIYNYDGTLTMTNSTVWGNAADSLGGGIFQRGGGAVTLKNTLLEKNVVAGSTPQNCMLYQDAVRITSMGYNLSDDFSCSDLIGTGDQQGIDAKLDDSLRSNGGPTLTVALLAGSPAIDRIPVTDSTDIDQRGIARPQGILCDIGAFEYVPGNIPPETIAVQIDIKPGSYPNSINLGSNGTVPVAILSSTEFYAGTVDPTTVALSGATVKLRGKGTPMTSLEDVNGNSLPDLVVHVSTEALQLTLGDAIAILTGQTYGGDQIQGSDTVRIIP